jgi:hypothetical protein
MDQGSSLDGPRKHPETVPLQPGDGLGDGIAVRRARTACTGRGYLSECFRTWPRYNGFQAAVLSGQQKGKRLQANIPDEWVGKKVAIHFKVDSPHMDQPWAATVVQGTITEKNDLGIRIDDITSMDAETMLIAYDALLSVTVQPSP